MLKKCVFLITALIIVLSLLSCELIPAELGPSISGTYVCTEGSTKGEEFFSFEEGCFFEFKKDGALYIGFGEGEPGTTGKWELDGDEILITTEFFGSTIAWKGRIHGDTIVLMDGSTWVKEKAAAPTTPTPSPEKATPQAIRPGMISVGDLSFALTSVEREEQAAYLYFAITKLDDTGSMPASMKITLTDDRNNKYEGELDVTPEGSPANFLTLLPQDFTYVVSVTMTMPKAAPIMRIKLAETEEVAFKEVRLTDPQFKSAFGAQLLKPGVAVSVGESLVFSAERIAPDLHTWAVPVTIENKDYNQVQVSLQVAVQYADGHIEATAKSAASLSLPGLSKKTTRLILHQLWGKGAPELRMLLMFYSDEAVDKSVLKLWPVSGADLPPRVGQGTNEDLFIDAYLRNGGREVMGDPLGLPRWFTGGTQPKDENDVLVQEFPAVSDFEKSVITWDKQARADKAHVLHGAILEKYLNLGGPRFRSEIQGNFLGAPVSDEVRGTYSAFEGGTIALYQGKTFFMESIFFEAYMRNNGLEVMGEPLGRPHWYAGDTQLKDKYDLLIQEFPAISEFGKSAIIWDKEDNTSEAYVIHGAILERYSSLGGPYSELGAPASDERIGKVPTSSRLEIGGVYNTFEGGIIALQQGRVRIFFSPPFGQIWSFRTGSYVFSSPTIASDGTIYVGSWDDKIYALNPDGTLKWSFKTGDNVESSPAIASDGTIYVGSKDDKIYALNPDGTLKWSFKTGGIITSSPAIAPDGTIYVGSGYGNGKMYALTPNGSLKWSSKAEYYVYSSPAIASDGTIYVGSGYGGRGEIFALSPDGTLRWSFEAGFNVSSSPAIASDGTIYVGSRDGKIYALNPDGTLKWPFKTGADVVSSPAIAPDGTIYVGSCDGKIYALNPDGSLKWSFKTGGSVGASPAIAFDGTIYVGSNDHRFYALNPDGSLKWSLEVGGDFKCDIQSSPAISPDGTIYVGSKDGNIYAIKEENGGLADSPWPMFHHDAQHTGRQSLGVAPTHGSSPTQLTLSYSVGPQFSLGSTPNYLLLPTIAGEDQRLMFPLVAHYIDAAASVTLSVTLEVTDSKGLPVSAAQIFMGRQVELGTTDNNGRLVHELVFRIPPGSGDTPASLSFSAKKGDESATVDVPLYTASTLEKRSFKMDEGSYEDYKEALYLYNLGKPGFPLPKPLDFLKPFLPLLKVAADLKKGPQVGDQISLQLIEYRVPGEEPTTWVYNEQIQRDDSTVYSQSYWVFSEEDMQRIRDTYFFGELA